MDERLNFLFLTEEEAVKAGAGNMERCIEVMDEVFELLGQGDYLMGTPNHNAHGIKIYFPKEPKFPDMPKKGPDRRFMALVAYLGGRFHVCGEKWYGSNIANRDRGLPRSILTTLLNDPDTGAPIAFLSANTLSATRTGAIPALGAKYYARRDAEVLTQIGAGVVGRSCTNALLLVLKNIKEVRVYDLNRDAAQSYCDELEKSFHIKAVAADSIEQAVRDADVVNVVTSGAVSPKIEDEWLKEGVLLSLPESADISTGPPRRCCSSGGRGSSGWSARQRCRKSRPSRTVTGAGSSLATEAQIRMAAGMARNISCPRLRRARPTSAGLPVHSRCPPSKTAAWVARGSASSSRCSVRRMVVPSSRLMRPSVCRKSAAAMGSS